MSTDRPSIEAFGAELSARARAFFSRLHIFRDLSRTCSFERLGEELDRRGVPWYDAIFALEEEFGGLVQKGTHPRRPHLALGLFQLVCLDLPRDEDEDGEDDGVLAAGCWPVVHRRTTGEPLIHVGLYTPEGDIYIDESGRIYWHVVMLDRLEMLAGSARGFLERLALEDEVRLDFGDCAETLVETDAALEIVSHRTMARVEEASDGVAEHWRGEGLFISRLPVPLSRRGPRTSHETRIFARSPDDLLAAVRSSLEKDPDAKLRVDVYGPTGQKQRAALERAGIPLRR
jgi:hypothetical protein